ncbi:hypothetical protein GGX14DRAFT_412996 [Mycena pura]|uniref:Uncharacterized protein n=1 Tax=Mycena pura TaxID=153505 RepID=A0AAD7E560_9AGAR|nr:hypothetical protein GGX14DRAFT_412996 [Mycena pura]
MSEHTSLVLDNGDLIQFPPITYADATDIASKFPELAAKVLNEPLASPVRAARDVELAEPEGEAIYPRSIVVERMALSPPHTPDRPNWALAPDDPESSPVRTYNDSWSRRARGGPPSRRQSSTYAQGQEELEEMGQFGRRSSQSERFSGQGHGVGAGERGHDMPPHLAAEAARDSAMSASFQSYSPSRSSAPPLDAWGPATGGGAPVENSALAPAADEWIQIHDGWAVRGAEKHSEAHGRPDGAALDEWTPVHDGWAVRHDGADQPMEAHHRPDGGAVNEWTTRHDPWTENHDRQTLEPQNKCEAPSRIRGSSPFRDRMNDSANQSDRSGSFSADVLYVRPPVQSSIASLAASHAAEMGRRDAREHIPVEFDYFAHSNAIDWTSSAPTKPGQNAFSPSQRVSSPAHDSGDASHAQHSATSSPDRRASENHLNNGGHDDDFQVNLPPSASTFVVGSMKSDWQYRDGESHRRASPASSWGPPGSDRVQEHRDGGRGKAGDSHEFTTGNDGYDRGQESNNRFCGGGSAYESRGKRLPTQNEEYRKFRESMGYGSGPRYSDAQRGSYGARNLLLPAADNWNY